MKELERELKEEARVRREEAKQRKIEKLRRKAENTLKNSRFQVIKKTQTIKNMNKKQLRSLKKMQVNAYTGAVEFVNPFTGRQDDDYGGKKKKKKKSGRR